MESCMRSCDGFLLVYSVDDEESVTVLSELYERVIRVKNNDQVPLIIFTEICREIRQSQLKNASFPKQMQKHKRRKKCSILFSP
ncbi:hypothetical protein KSF78_0006070 [Schistosoma japonicum]|nr:hypothetical protein KSF78_0006070 [Schistosoma japonicum]